MAIPTVTDLFDGERQAGDLVCRYKDWELPLSDGTMLKGGIANYIVVRRVGSAYFEVFVPELDPKRAAEITDSMLEPLIRDPSFFLPNQ